MNSLSIIKVSLLVLGIFVGSFGYAQQPTTLCKEYENISNYIEITGGTPASNGLVSGMPNVHIWLKGTLSVPTNFVMNNWIIKAEQGTRIQVIQGASLTANNTKGFCCNDFWNGISVAGKSKLNLNSCQIEDASKAVFTDSYQATVSLYGNTFNRNQHGLYWKNATSHPASANIAQFSNNTFSCNSDLNDGAKRSISGLYLENAVGTLTQTLTNKFIDQTNGVSTSNCFYDIFSCSFERCEYGIYAVATSMNQKGLGQLESVPTFSSCTYGIYADRVRISSENNYFKNCKLDAVKLRGKARGVTWIKDNTFNIDNITSNGFNAGISVMGSFTSIYGLSITNNHFRCFEPVYCILIPGNASVAKNITIADNYFDISVVAEVCEMQLGASGAQMTFQGNYLQADPTSTSQFGAFHFHNHTVNKEHYVEDNHVYINNPMGFNFPEAFFLINSRTHLCDNSTEGSSYGYHFVGDGCDGTAWASSSIGKHVKHGIFIQDGKIGTQDLRGNCWSLINNYGDFAAKCNGSPLFSKIYVDASISCHYPVGSISPSVGWFDPTGSGEIGCDPHPNQSPPPPSGTVLGEWETKTANGQNEQVLSNATELWNAQWMLYSKLALHPELRPPGSLMDSFYLAQGNTSIGQYFAAEHLWADAGRPTDIQESQLFQSLDSLEGMLSNLRTRYAEWLQYPEDTLVYASIVGLLSDAEQEAEAFSLQDSMIMGQREQLIDAALAAYQSLPVCAVYQQNLRKVRMLCLSKIRIPRDFTEAEMIEIREIAAQCQSIGGLAVTIARGMLPTKEEQVLYAQYDEDCLVQKNSLSTSGRLPSGNLYWSLSPNPASSNLNILFPEFEVQVAKVDLVNLLGETVLSRLVSEGQTSVDLSVDAFPRGIYHCLATSLQGAILYSDAVIVW